MLGQPALVLGNARGDAQRKALLAQQGVPSVAAAEGQDLPRVRQVGDEHLLWVAGPRVDQRGWRRGRRARQTHGQTDREETMEEVGE